MSVQPLEAVGVSGLFLPEDLREELRDLQDELEEDLTKKERNRIIKKIQQIQRTRVDALAELLDADESGTLRGWVEGIIDTDDDSDTFGSVKSADTLRRELEELAFWDYYNADEAAWFYAKYAGRRSGEAQQLDYETSALNALDTLSSELGITVELAADELQAFVDDYYNNGFQLAANLDEFRRYLIQNYGDNIEGNTDEALRMMARNFGVMRDDAWYLDAEKKILGNEAKLEAYQDQFRKEAELMYPMFTEQLQAGSTLWDIMSPWKTATEQILEYAPTDMNDPNLRYALEAMGGEGGMPEAMSIAEYKKYLRNRPEWLATDNGRKTVDDQMISLAKMFGIVG